MMKKILLLIVATLFPYVGWSQTMKVVLKNDMAFSYDMSKVESIGFVDETQETQAQEDYSIVGRWEVVYCRYLEEGCDWNMDKAIGTIVEFYNNGQVSFMGKTKTWKVVNRRVQLFASGNDMIESDKILLLNKDSLEIFISNVYQPRALVRLKRVSY